MPIRSLPQAATRLDLSVPPLVTMPAGGGELVLVVRNSGPVAATGVELVAELQGGELVVGRDRSWQSYAPGVRATLAVSELGPGEGFEATLPLVRGRRIVVGAPAVRVLLSLAVRADNAPAVRREVTVDVPPGVAGAGRPTRGTVFS
ncbi:MAG: hypothetical protein EPO22_06090 [Dehalococcoidia bacterium]|nr:MAG: hypothetical protein EPO22_06090 [Dehalococcoidia bacterium]